LADCGFSFVVRGSLPERPLKIKLLAVIDLTYNICRLK